MLIIVNRFEYLTNLQFLGIKALYKISCLIFINDM